MTQKVHGLDEFNTSTESVQSKSVQSNSVQPNSVHSKSVRPESVQPESVRSESVRPVSVQSEDVQAVCSVNIHGVRLARRSVCSSPVRASRLSLLFFATVLICIS